MANDPIKFKVGTSKPQINSKNPHTSGTVYFAVDANNQICQIYFDENGGTRVNVVPEIVDCGEWKTSSGTPEPASEEG